MAPDAPRHTLPWEEWEDAFIRVNKDDMSEDEIAQYLGRRFEAVRARIKLKHRGMGMVEDHNAWMNQHFRSIGSQTRFPVRSSR